MPATLNLIAALATRRSADGTTDLILAETIRETADVTSTGPADKKLIPLVATRGEVFSFKAIGGEARVMRVAAGGVATAVTASQSYHLSDGERVEWLMREGEQIAFLAEA